MMDGYFLEIPKIYLFFIIQSHHIFSNFPLCHENVYLSSMWNSCPLEIHLQIISALYVLSFLIHKNVWPTTVTILFSSSEPSLAFCRPSVSTSWVRNTSFNSDIINGNTSFCIDQPWKEIKIAEAVFNTKSLPPFDDFCWFYLVESKQTELLMIMRTVDKRNYFTKSFRIFKLNESDDSYNDRRHCSYPYYWKDLSSLLVKESIILLRNEGMSISVDDQNGHKSNSIYFYDE